jgi:predicted nucleic-acid-binding protein
MAQRRMLDTNLIVRHLTQDHAEHSRAADILFKASDDGMVTLIILPVVLAECVFVLESFYKHSREQISAVLAVLLSSSGVELGDAALYREALDRYGKSNAHFIDCVIASFAVALNISIATFDAGFGKFGDVHVENNC